MMLLFLLMVQKVIDHLAFLGRTSREYIQLESLYGGIMGTQTCVT